MKKITLTFEITDEMGLKAIEAEYVSPEIEYSSKLLKALLVAGLKSLNNNPEACMVADLLWEQNIAVKK